METLIPLHWHTKRIAKQAILLTKTAEFADEFRPNCFSNSPELHDMISVNCCMKAKKRSADAVIIKLM